MDFSFTDDQLAARDLAVQLLADVDPKGVPGLDRALWSRLGEAGLLGLCLPEQDGGAGYGVTELALVCEEAGRRLARVPLAVAVGAAAAIARHGDAGLRGRLLPGLVAGTEVVTAAWAEPFGADPLQPRTRLEDGVLHGEKTAVPLAREATAVLVPAVGPDGLVLAVVDPATATVVDEQTTSGEPAATLLLDGAAPLAVLPADAAVLAYQWTTVALAATQVGIASEALRRAADHTSTREQFGRPLATFQAVAVRLGNAYIDIEALRSTTWQAAFRVDAGLPAAEQVATAAFWAAEAGERVASSAVHLHGGLGVDTDYPLHRFFLASKQVELSLGGASRQLELLADTLVPSA
ncbi:MAG TPA: acyl-CoA dehydrogenase family protein [Mycobacteriales bacterium]|nr:acyl-CoA dehydrogenase family protein [Mycobacteriales bacterium]